jgi:phage/plasmid-associated DNA primase
VEATRAYLASEDWLTGWIEDCCELGDRKYEAAGLLYASYRKWAQARGEKDKDIETETAFGSSLDSRRIVAKKVDYTRCRITERGGQNRRRGGDKATFLGQRSKNGGFLRLRTSWERVLHFRRIKRTKNYTHKMQ